MSSAPSRRQPIGVARAMICGCRRGSKDVALGMPVVARRYPPGRLLYRWAGRAAGSGGRSSDMIPTPSRPPASIYVAGLFAQEYTEFYTFLIPLYGLSLGISAGKIGLLVGARSFLSVFLSIHIG